MANEPPGDEPGCADGCARAKASQTEDDWLERYRAARERASAQRILKSIDERLGCRPVPVETDYDILKQ